MALHDQGIMAWDHEVIGIGETGRGTNDGGAHVGGRGLNGFAAVAQLLERRGWQVERSRSEARLVFYEKEACAHLAANLRRDREIKEAEDFGIDTCRST